MTRNVDTCTYLYVSIVNEPNLLCCTQALSMGLFPHSTLEHEAVHCSKH